MFHNLAFRYKLFSRAAVLCRLPMNNILCSFYLKLKVSKIFIVRILKTKVPIGHPAVGICCSFAPFPVQGEDPWVVVLAHPPARFASPNTRAPGKQISLVGWAHSQPDPTYLWGIQRRFLAANARRSLLLQSPASYKCFIQLVPTLAKYSNTETFWCLKSVATVRQGVSKHWTSPNSAFAQYNFQRLPSRVLSELPLKKTIPGMNLINVTERKVRWGINRSKN